MKTTFKILFLSLLILTTGASCNAQKTTWEHKKKELLAFAKDKMEKEAINAGVAVPDTFTALYVDTITERKHAELLLEQSGTELKNVQNRLKMLKDDSTNISAKIRSAGSADEKQKLTNRSENLKSRIKESEHDLARLLSENEQLQKAVAASDPDKHYGYFMKVFMSITDRTSGHGVRGNLGYIFSEDMKVEEFQFPDEFGSF